MRVCLQVVEIMSNTRLSERYLALARDLDVLEPKLPEDVYKMHLVDTQRGGLAPALDSAAKNLSATLVNALLNLGFGNDKLVTPATQEGERALWRPLGYAAPSPCFFEDSMRRSAQLRGFSTCTVYSIYKLGFFWG
jgi:hypothetical protein